MLDTHCHLDRYREPVAIAREAERRNVFVVAVTHLPSHFSLGLPHVRASEGQATRDLQLESFRFVAASVKGRDKLLSLHSRKAESAVLDILMEFKLGPAIFHWFSGKCSTLDEVLAQGHYASVNPAMLRTKTGRDIIERVPPNRILTETDGPYVRIGAEPVSPWDVDKVEAHLAGAWGMSQSDARGQIWLNFCEVLSANNIMNAKRAALP
jgi:TatD DNase family protein